MDVVHPRCAGVDVSERDAKGCVRVVGAGRAKAESTVTTWGSVTNQVLALRDHLIAEQVTLVVMEATGDDWKPFYALLEDGPFEVMLVNARHVKNLPGRKTDVSDAAWLADLGAHGPVRGSFVPPEPIRQLRDLTRARTTITRDRAREMVYYYFTDKDDLARDLQHRLWEQPAQDALAVYDPERPVVDNLLVCFEAFLTTVQAMAGAKTFLREAWFSPALDAAGRADHEDALGLVHGLLAQGMDRGEIARLDSEALTRILVGALMEATLHTLGRGEIEPTMAVIRHLVQSFAIESVRSAAS